MRSSPLLALAGVGVVASSNNFECASTRATSTLYVTVPPSTVTKTVYASADQTAVLSVASIVSNATSYVISTHVIALAVETPPSKRKFDMDHSFVVKSGKIPETSPPLVVQTSTVLLEPVPFASAKALPANGHEFQDTTSPSLKKTHRRRHGKSSWNATTFSKIESVPILPEDPHAESYQKGNDFLGKAVSQPSHSSFSRHHVHARDSGDVIVAEIDGVLVSWTNEYQGTAGPPSSTTVAATPTPTITLPVYPWNISESAPSMTSSSVPKFSDVHSVTLAAYPWDIGKNLDPAGSDTLLTISKTSSNYPAVTTIRLHSEASASASTCDGPSTFTVDFDDLPHFSMSLHREDMNIPPIFNPYRKLYWQDHFGYVPPPSDPFKPKSPPQLAVYRSQGIGAQGSPDAGLELSGEVGAGPRAPDSAYWIDARSAWLGCADGGSVGCSINIKGFKEGASDPIASQNLKLGPCPALRNCSLTYVEFHDDFTALSGLQIVSDIGGRQVDYYMDDLVLSWSNGSCAAQEVRVSAE